MIIDVITYNGEKELFEIRYNLLKDLVDVFVVVEFDKTFSGNVKGGKFIQDFGYPGKVALHYHTEDLYNKYMDLALSSPNTIGADHWKREFCQKESIKDALKAMKLKHEDIVFVGDCDEIWNEEALAVKAPIKLKLRVYAYYLNNLSTEQFWGTTKLKYRDIKKGCLNHLRTNTEKSEEYFGWHFTSMYHQLAQKLTDSYTKETYATDEVMANLQNNIDNNRDFLGRDFKYEVNESDWPEKLKVNRQMYSHLLK